MTHVALDRIKKRAETAKSDSDFAYFHSLLLNGEALLKLTVIGFISCLADDPDRNKYRLEYQIVKADGLGPWAKALQDATTGPASQFLLDDLSIEKNELTKSCGKDTWQYESVSYLKSCLDALNIEFEAMPTIVDMNKWFSMFVVLRNKTRGHGATLPGQVNKAAGLLENSINIIVENHSLFKRPWAYLYKNLSGKYRVTTITKADEVFDELKKGSQKSYIDGVYIRVGSPRVVSLLMSDADLTDFYFPNGGFTKSSYECISYATDARREGDSSYYLRLPGSLPPSETQGLGELLPLGNCFSNAPKPPQDYISRSILEDDLKILLLDDRHPIITLLGRGGIGKTSLALNVLPELSSSNRFEIIMWFSSRDVDLQFNGPKAVKPQILSAEDASNYYVNLVAPQYRQISGFASRKFFETQLFKNEIGPCLYIFDNFETARNPVELYNWIDTHVRLPNKVLITTRLRDFKGDYPIEVGGMRESEAKELIKSTSKQLEISHLLTPEYIEELIQQSEGHPYVIKILLGEVKKENRAGNIPRFVANRDEILTALFERTYSSLGPSAQRVFMTLAAWNSAVSRLVLEAVLHRSIEDRGEVENSIDILLQYSLAEQEESIEKHKFLALPLVAGVFGRKKLNITPLQASIKSDAELLQMLGPVSRSEIYISLKKQIEIFLKNIAQKVEHGESFEKYSPILEMIGRNFPPAWLSLARWHREQGTPDGDEKAKAEIRRFLEQDSISELASNAWRDLADICYKSHDLVGNLHAFIKRSKIASVPFYDLSSTAKKMNELFKDQNFQVDFEGRRALAEELLEVMVKRQSEAKADDFSQMAWLAIRIKDRESTRKFIEMGLALEPDNQYLLQIKN